MVHSYAQHVLANGKGIFIDLDDGVFGHQCDFYVHFEDINPFCLLEPISGNCILVYIWHLYTKIKKQDTHTGFQFVNPFAISYVGNANMKECASAKPNECANALAKRLISALSNQLVLVPCNVGEHWILTVIEPHKEVVYLLDPLSHRIRDDWRYVVNIAMRLFNASLGKKGKTQPTWEIIKGPRQPYNK